jgi:transcriptional regulator with XRE-family HTH domain
MSLGRRITEKRLENNMSQAELAAKIKTSPTMVSLYESDNRIPSYKKLGSVSLYLNTTLDYLMNGSIEAGNDPISKKIALALRVLNTKQKVAVFEYICQTTDTGCYDFDIKVCNNAEEYADALVKKFDLSPPIDLRKVAELLSINILEVKKNEEFEGLLIKTGSAPVIILDDTNEDKQRRNFTLAMMIGHLIMPWHLRSQFGRRHGERSFEITDSLSIEAREFAIALLVPKICLEKDIKKLQHKPTYKDFEEFAYNRYEVSVTALLKRYIQLIEKDNMIFLKCFGGVVKEINECSFSYTVVTEVHPDSLAGKLMNHLPNDKCTLNGYVASSLWLVDEGKDLLVYEESYVDPKKGWVMTILRIN